MALPSGTTLNVTGTTGADTFIAANGKEAFTGNGGGDLFDLSGVTAGQYTINAFAANGSADVIRLPTANFANGFSDVTAKATQVQGGVSLPIGGSANVLLANATLSALTRAGVQLSLMV